MAFFLIGRGPDDDLRLISPKSFESRQAAMAELSVLSAEPTFAHWNAAVSVMDLDTGAPVLLVRSAAASPVAEPAPAESDAAGAWEADMPVASAGAAFAASVVPGESALQADAAPIEEPSAAASNQEPTAIAAEPLAETAPKVSP